MEIFGERRIMSLRDEVAALPVLAVFPPPAPDDAFVCDGCDRTENRDAAAQEAVFLRELRRSLLLATLAASVTYEAGLCLPGGFWQGNGRGDKQTSYPILQTGEKVILYFKVLALVVPCLLLPRWTSNLHHRNRMKLYLLAVGLIGSYALWGSRNATTSICAIAVAAALLNTGMRGRPQAPLDDEASIYDGNRAEDPWQRTDHKRRMLMLLAILVASISYQCRLMPQRRSLIDHDDVVAGPRAREPILRFLGCILVTFFLGCILLAFMIFIAFFIQLSSLRRQPAFNLESCTGPSAYMAHDAYIETNLKTHTHLLRGTTILETPLTRRTLCSKSSQMSTVQVLENRGNRLQAMLLFNFVKLKRCIELRIKCLGTGKSTISSMVHLLDPMNIALHSDGSGRQHQNKPADEGNGKPCSNNAPATNSSDETTRAPMAQKLIVNNDKENQSDPDSCVAERDPSVEGKQPATWYVATGAACHATGDSDLITAIVEAEDDDGLCVHAADGTPMPVRGRGNVVTDTVVLPDVYYVPGLRTNLVSVGQLAGLDYSVGFGRGACVFNSAAGRVVGRAHAGKDGLYKVDFLVIPLDMR